MTAQIKQRPFSMFVAWLGFLSVVMIAGAVAGAFVLLRGLSITNLSDKTPWGLWITIDMSAIALSAGAFTLCAGVYLLRLDQFKRLARLAAFVGLTGYTVAMLCLFLDLGRPDRFYYGFIYWNTHSVLWEVTMCIGLYFIVLIFENLSNFARFEWVRSKFPVLANWMAKSHDFAPYLAVAGLALSVLHQSSLGASYGVLIARPIWYRPGLAGLYFVSAILGGIAMTTLVAVLSGLISSTWKLERKVLNQISVFLGWGLMAYLYLRFWDLFAMTYTDQPGRVEGLNLLTQGAFSFNLWFGEVLFGILVPAIILFVPRFRKNSITLLSALMMIVGGLIAYRWDVNMVGQAIVQSPLSSVAAPQFTSYSPSLIEWLSGAGIVAFGLAVISLGIRYLGLLDPKELTHV